MSSPIWTPRALWPERRRLSGPCWRVVESQHRVATMKLVDTLEEQAALETLLDATKPQVPPGCRHLHYLLFTPFRYGSPYPTGSRFRRAGLTPGVFYGSQTTRTAIAEMAFHRLLFFAESPETPWPVNAGEYTAFLVKFRSSAGLDLTLPPLDADRSLWTKRTDYRACQQLADVARRQGIDVLRYESARAPEAERGRNLALLVCSVFVSREPAERQTWRIYLGTRGVQSLCAFPDERLAFGRQAFADDSRIARMRWER
jgi:RES domain-containing protein